MQTSLFQSAQRIIAQTLQWLTSSTDSAITERVADTFQNGVCYNELNSMAIVNVAWITISVVFVTIFDHFYFKESLSQQQLCGLIIAVVGFILINMKFDFLNSLFK